MTFGTLHFLPDLTPKTDERFSHLLSQALDGQIPVYFAAIPLALCVPFDLDYRPDLHSVGAEAIKQAASDARQGKPRKMFAYQHGYWFVVPDDYIPYFAALTGLPDYVPCFILGQPEHDLIRDLQGPIDPISFRQLLGFTTKEGHS